MKRYNPKSIEAKWQKYWATKKLFVAKEGGKKKKKFVMFEFPYPSGAGLHVGHLRPYVATDVYARYNRLKGFEVLYPMGWDAFGLPAENYAIKTGIHPRITTAKVVAASKKQMQSWGVSLDWSREINTTDPEYYKWTQWIFLQFFKAGLAYEATGLINWCPKDKTGLANEEVINGACERCGTTVEKKELRQWYLKITAYAEKLLQGLNELKEWPEQVKLQQANWIGKSTGAEIKFSIKNYESSIKVFTTRPDTIFGATYLVLAPEHELIKGLESRIENWEEVGAYMEETKKKDEMARTAESKEKTGVELKGVKAINPATKEQIPVWVADYVLGNYGTGAIMAVPAHDERDFDFAKKFNLEIRQVLEGGSSEKAFVAEGALINSGKFTGKNSKQSIEAMAKEFGEASVQYKLRDWVFSRQRYWGEPIPLVFCSACKERVENSKLETRNSKLSLGERLNPGWVAVAEKGLPLTLPPVKKYEPTGTGESPLASITQWVTTKCPRCKGPAKRETNTMPNWAGSSWYWLRYTDPKNKKELASKAKLKYWTPVDTYFGGWEHTTLHLLYSRFWNQFLYDQKVVATREPYKRRVPHEVILGPDGNKMSKSKGNVVNPDDVIKKFGADSLRMYEMFIGPYDARVAWNDQGVVGVRRFLDRIWHWGQSMSEKGKGKSEKKESKDVLRALHKLIKKVTEDLDNFRFNTCVPAFMEFHNQIKDEPISKDSYIAFLTVLSPFAPHLAEELYQLAGGKKSLQTVAWPKFNPKLIVEDLVEIVVQVNGKVRERLHMPAGSSEAEVKALALESDKVQPSITGEIRRVIFVPNRLLNIVV